MPVAGTIQRNHLLLALGVIGLAGGIFLFLGDPKEHTHHGDDHGHSHGDGHSHTHGSDHHHEHTTSKPISTPKKDYTKDVLKYKDRKISSSIIKDVFASSPYKINVYQDKGKTSVNRIKVDLDRDDKWDEIWTFDENGGISKKVATQDDENYNNTYRWMNNVWELQK